MVTTRPGRWRLAVAAIEVALAIVTVVLDVWVPTLVLLALLGLSLAYHREGPSSLGLRRHPRPARLVLIVLAAVVVWTAVKLALVIPVLERATGQRQDVSAFTGLQGNLGGLLTLLAISWTLAAVGEELVYRGFVQTRMAEVVGGGRLGAACGVVVSAVLFGLAHSEQGPVGVGLTFLDAIFFSVLRLRFGTLWAPVLAHGLANSVGLIAFYLVGPVYALW